MVPTVSSQSNRRAGSRWQDKVIACCWLPFRLLFHLWVYLTPSYEEKWGFVSSQSPAHTRPPLFYSFLLITLVTTSVLGFALFALLSLPPLCARLLLFLVFGFSLRQFLRPKR